MSSDLLVPGLAGRAFLQIHVSEEGIRPHTLFDVENRLLQTLLLVQFRLFRRFLFFQCLVGEVLPAGLISQRRFSSSQRSDPKSRIAPCEFGNQDVKEEDKVNN